MKILHLIYSEQVAGAERYLLDLLPGLKNSGIECSLICVTPPIDKHKFTDFCDELNQHGVEAILLTATKYNFFSVAATINSYLRKNTIKNLHAHLFKSDLLAVMVKKLFNHKLFLISTKHGYQEKYFNNYPTKRGEIRRDVYYLISRYLCRNINAQFTISKAMSDLYYELKLSKDRMQFIYHGISVSPLVKKAIFEEKESVTHRLLVVGRLETIKGHEYLLKAMPDVIKRFPGVKLQIIGNGTQKQKLKELAVRLAIANSIEFLGFQHDPYPFIASADIMVLPSLFEPFGLVYLEAFALKVPIVAFDVPACNEIVVNNETGLLVPVGDSAGLAQKINLLLEKSEERERLSENGYHQYVNYYNSKRMIRDTVNWYGTVLKN